MQIKSKNALLSFVTLCGISFLTDICSDRNLFFSTSTLEDIGRLARMSVLDTEIDGSNPGSSMLFP